MEMVWTRLLSAEYFYTFAFFVLSIALLGLGVGALFITLFTNLRNEKFLSLYLLLTGLLAVLGPILLFKIDIKFSLLANDWLMIGKLILAYFLLGASFFTGGMALALIFKLNHRIMPKLYMTDLMGAGLGVIFAIFMMNQFGTPKALFFIVLPVIIASLLCGRYIMRVAALITLMSLFWFSQSSGDLLEIKRPERGLVVYKHWDAFSKIKVYDDNQGYRGINIDNIANMPVYEFDGDWNKPDSFKFEFGINVSYLLDKFDSCVFLSLGSGGGVDV